MTKHKFPYEWTLKDADFHGRNGLVFSCFACGGGSSMGYKLAGYNVIGCNEIDHRMMYAYCRNHNPKFQFLEPIQEFKNRKDARLAIAAFGGYTRQAKTSIANCESQRNQVSGWQR